MKDQVEKVLAAEGKNYRWVVQTAICSLEAASREETVKGTGAQQGLMQLKSAVVESPLLSYVEALAH